MMLDWSLLLALATFSLAGAAFWSIWQNRLLQNRERRERLLNEIMEWAIDTISSGYDLNIAGLVYERTKGKVSIDSAEEEEIRIAFTSALIDRLSQLEARGLYVWRIALSFNKDLKEVTLITSLKLNQQIKILFLYLEGKLKNFEAIGRHRRTKLNYNAKKIIEEAVKIKTKDIS